MNKVEENVLVPKEEYETLLEKVSATNQLIAKDSVTTPDTPELFPDDVKANVSTSPSDTPTKSEVRLKKSDMSKEASLSTEMSEAEPEIVDEVEGSNRDTDDSSDMIDMLLVKVPPKLKDSVRLLATYIAENGEGIIEWDKELRFVHLKEVVPKTNFVKIIIYALENVGNPPKGVTLFKRSLKSIGVNNVKSWVFSQTGGMMSPYIEEEEEKQVSGKRPNDSTDGFFSDDEQKTVKKSGKGKSTKLNKLATKWVSW